MPDSKKSPEEGSIFSKLASSIEDIEKEDSRNDSKDQNENKDQSFDDELPPSSKAGELFSEDSKRKFPVMAISGLIIGSMLVLSGILLFLGNSERVVDNVAFGETGASSIFVIFLGVLFIGASALKFISKSNPLSNTFVSIKELELLDEDEFDKKENDKIVNK